MKPHAWWPIIAAFALVGVCWWLAMRNHEQGKNGPDVPLGIYPPGEMHIPSIGPERLNMKISVSDSEHPYVIDGIDRRRGLEVVPWDGIVVCMEDHHALTRTLAKALAEHLTGHLALHAADSAVDAQRAAAMVIMLPAGESMKLPLPVRRVLRVGTLMPDGASFDRLTLGDAVELEFRMALSDTMSPGLRSQSGLSPATGIQEQAWVAQVQVAATDDPDTTWPRWHATVGRAAADALLAQALTPQGPVVAWQYPLDHRAAAPQRYNHNLTNVPRWEGTIGMPPRTGVERWFGVVQTPLLRGWSGVITGLTVPKIKKGIELDTIAAFTDVLGTEKWQGPEIDEDTGTYLWRGTDLCDFDRLIAEPRDWGWVVTAYEVHPEWSAILDGWVTASTDDLTARAHLREHARSPLLSNDQRQRIEQALLAQQDIANLAILGEASTSSAEAQAVAGTIRWLRGMRSKPPESLATISFESFSDWVRTPALLNAEGQLKVAVPVGTDGWASWQRDAEGIPSYTFSAPSVEAPAEPAPASAE